MDLTPKLAPNFWQNLACVRCKNIQSGLVGAETFHKYPAGSILSVTRSADAGHVQQARKDGTACTNAMQVLIQGSRVNPRCFFTLVWEPSLRTPASTQFAAWMLETPRRLHHLADRPAQQRAARDRGFAFPLDTWIAHKAFCTRVGEKSPHASTVRGSRGNAAPVR